MKYAFTVFMATWCFFGNALFAQKQRMETDRPSETQTPAITKRGYFQAEIGFQIDQQRGHDYTVLHPQTQLKYGLTERFELRAELTGKSEKQFSKNEFRYGLQPVEIGFKAELLEQKGALPTTSFYTQLGIPNWASEDHKKAYFFPELRLLFENKLSDKIKLSYNAGAEWQGDATAPRWLYTFAPEFQLGKKWEAFIETFAYLQSGQAAQHHLDGGFAFNASNNIKFDL